MSDIDTRIDDRSIDQPATYDGSDPGLEATAAGPSAFLADLARAMQATVEARRVQVVDEADQRRKAHVDGIRAREDAGVEELREIASQDVKGIEIWATGEIERIRLERQRRVAARKADLERRLEDHHQLIEREVDAVERSVSGYREEVETFFNGLDAESDPVLIARHAANLPPFPALELIGPDEDAAAVQPAWSAAATTPTSAWTNGNSGPVDATIDYPANGSTPVEDAPTTPEADVATDDAPGDAPADAVAAAEAPVTEADDEVEAAADETQPDQIADPADEVSAARDEDPELVGVMDPNLLIGVDPAPVAPSAAGYIAPWDRHPSAVAQADDATEELGAPEVEGSEAVSMGTLRIAPRSSGAVAHSGPTLRPIGSWLRRLNHS